MTADAERPDPDKLLAKLKAEEARTQSTRGRLRVYLGAAPGAGKTFAMLNEGRRRKERGTDVVIGYVETYDRPLTVQAAEGLEVVPRRRVEYRGTVLEEMDVDAVIARRPQVALVDELAHTNAPGSEHEKRYQDVEQLLDAGIDVVSTVNIQHLESLNDLIESITGIPVRETIPDRILDQANEVELVDITPDALRKRMRHGNVYPANRIPAALDHFFTKGNLTALREIALRRVAQEVDEALADYLRGHPKDQSVPASDRIMVCLDHRPLAAQLLRRGSRMSQRLKAELLAVTVEHPHRPLGPVEQKRLKDNQELAEDLGAELVVVGDTHVAKALAQVARARNVTQIIVGHPQRGRWPELLSGGSIVFRLLRLLPDVDIHVVAERKEKGA